MVKQGRRDKTGAFGDAAEAYVSQLFLLKKIPNGKRRPDLISTNGHYNPNLALEVKSGSDAKGSLPDFQLHNALTLNRNVGEKYGVHHDPSTGYLPQISEQVFHRIAYYYDVISREDALTSGDISKRFGSLDCKWGNQYLVPPEYVFYVFAIARSMRTGEIPEMSMEFIREKMRGDLVAKTIDHKSARRNDCAFQNVDGLDIKSIFTGNMDRASSAKKYRISMLKKLFPKVDDLKRVLLPGPNGTQIYILCEQEDLDTFKNDMQRILEQRIPIIERISRERVEVSEEIKTHQSNLALWDKNNKRCTDLFGRKIEEVETFSGLSKSLLDQASRLIFWKE